MHKYQEPRGEFLELDEIRAYDLYAPLFSAQPAVTYSKAQEILLEALAPLGEEYLKILGEAFSAGWIDVYENRGKRSGAYAWGAYGTHPYVLLNYTDNLEGLYTLAHELGHAVHSYLSNRAQPYVYADYTIFLAEVASTVNEVLPNKAPSADLGRGREARCPQLLPGTIPHHSLQADQVCRV